MLEIFGTIRIVLEKHAVKWTPYVKMLLEQSVQKRNRTYNHKGTVEIFAVHNVERELLKFHAHWTH